MPLLPWYQEGPRVSPTARVAAPTASADAMMRSGTGALAGARGAQGNALALYRDAAMGNAPSVAEIEMRKAADQNVANQMALAASGRSGNLNEIPRPCGPQSR
jgi:hypothetical protein